MPPENEYISEGRRVERLDTALNSAKALLNLLRSYYQESNTKEWMGILELYTYVDAGLTAVQREMHRLQGRSDSNEIHRCDETRARFFWECEPDIVLETLDRQPGLRVAQETGEVRYRTGKKEEKKS